MKVIFLLILLLSLAITKRSFVEIKMKENIESQESIETIEDDDGEYISEPLECEF